MKKTKYNYYVENMDKALVNHDCEMPLAIKIYGSKHKSNSMTLPHELFILMKNWYYLNGGNNNRFLKTKREA